MEHDTSRVTLKGIIKRWIDENPYSAEFKIDDWTSTTTFIVCKGGSRHGWIDDDKVVIFETDTLREARSFAPIFSVRTVIDVANPKFFDELRAKLVFCANCRPLLRELL